MQFHLNGFRPGDPDLKPAADRPEAELIDVVIVGAGPAGLTLAAYLAGFPDIRTVLLERNDGPLEKGQADGVSCRSMEMFGCFGFAERVMREAYWVNESVFWKPDLEQPGNITRSGRVQDVADDLSEMPHVILNQARIHDMYLDVMARAPTRLTPRYGCDVTGVHVDPEQPDAPVTVTLAGRDGAPAEVLRARYVVGCDGARSKVRQSMGRKLEGDQAHQAWGVMDVLATTDFPDIRFKCLIQSAGHGSLIIIPREGGYLVRLYVEIDQLQADERVAQRGLTQADVIAAAQRVLHPYVIDIKDVVWWSVYEIGHRLTDRFDNLPAQHSSAPAPRVFIAGDACHTHSPKAGQGMNVSMGDAFNLGWKLVSVLQGRAGPNLLRSYSEERQAVAQALIDFDHEWSRIISATAEKDRADTPAFQSYFIEHGRYTAGLSVRYAPSRLTADARWQHLATGLQIGMRLHSAPVIRLADGKPLQLGHVQQADGRWLLIAFAGGAGVAGLEALCASSSPLWRHTPPGADPDAVIDLRAVLQDHPHSVSIMHMPQALRPVKGHLGLEDYEKVFCADPKADIFERRGIDRDQGCLVLVRPDQYIADVLPLSDLARLGRFLDGVFDGQA